MELEITEENWKIHKYVEITQHAIEQPRVNKEMKLEIKKYLETNENEKTTYKKGV